MNSIHHITAADIRIGDRLAEEGVDGLGNWYHTSEAGRDSTVVDLQVDGDYLYLKLSSHDMPLETRPDIKVAVTR